MTVIDFRINGLDVIPDCLGYLLATLALLKLRELDPSFGWAAVITGVMTPISIASLSRPYGSYSKTGSDIGDLAWDVADVVVGWLVCSGILFAARRDGNGALAATAETRRVLVACAGLTLGLEPVLRHTSHGTAVAIAVVAGVFVVVVAFLLLGLLRQAGRALTLPGAPGIGSSA